MAGFGLNNLELFWIAFPFAILIASVLRFQLNRAKKARHLQELDYQNSQRRLFICVSADSQKDLISNEPFVYSYISSVLLKGFGTKILLGKQVCHGTKITEDDVAAIQELGVMTKVNECYYMDFNRSTMDKVNRVIPSDININVDAAGSLFYGIEMSAAVFSELSRNPAFLRCYFGIAEMPILLSNGLKVSISIFLASDVH